ncbi:MAG: amidohydrolase [Methanothrix sp.]
MLLNGTVYTVEKNVDWDKQPQEAVAISGNRIAYVGNDSGAMNFIGPNTKIVDLDGKMVLPGFIDAHWHPSLAAALVSGVILAGANTSGEYLKLIKKYALQNPNASVIRGFGWGHSAFGPKGPTKELLDSIVSDRPVFIFAIDGHSAWVNSKALEIAGITNKTLDPSSGIIERDSNGNPSGTLREESAERMVLSKLPPMEDETIMQGLVKILDMASRVGITTTSDAGVKDEKLMRIYSYLDKEGKLNIRIRGEQILDPNKGIEQIPGLDAEKSNYSSDLVQVNTAKLFIDGVTEAHTALLLEPYSDRPGFRSTPIWMPDTFNDTIVALDKAGFQIDIHAIGDGAVRMSLDAYERALKENGKRDSRHKISHVILLSPLDLPRFNKLGIIPVMQPNWFYYDSSYEKNLAYLGPERADHMMPMKSLVDSGATVAIGTDFPACSDNPTMNPLDQIKVGMTRQPLTPDNNITKPYWPEERVDLKTMIECATINGAYSAFMENEIGSLEVGKLADLVVIDKDLFKLPAEDINKAKVLTTVLEGRQVFSDFGEDTLGDLAKIAVYMRSADNILMAELDSNGGIVDKNDTLKALT